MTTSEEINRTIDGMILSGKAETGRDAELAYLNEHFSDVVELAETLDDEAFRRHELVRLLLFYGSRLWEDDLL